MLADTKARTLHVWAGEGKVHRLYPIAAPAGSVALWRGRTQVVRKVVGPDMDLRRVNKYNGTIITPGEILAAMLAPADS